MTEKDFRVKHSELIMYYQLIEMRLKGICAALLADQEKSWLERIVEYQTDPLWTLTNKLKDIQNDKDLVVLDADGFEAMNDLRKTRNYWVHQCFGGKDPIVFSRKGDLKVTAAAQKLLTDLNNAIEWDKKLADAFCSIKAKPPVL